MKKLINIVSHIIFGAILLAAGASAQADETLVQNEIETLLSMVLTETRIELAVPFVEQLNESLILSQNRATELSQSNPESEPTE